MTERTTVDGRDDGAPAATARLSFSVPTRQAFFERVVDRLRGGLPLAYQSFDQKIYFHLLKVSYANERVHYEVAVDVQRGLLEIALHFEDGPRSTLAHLELLDRHIVELKHTLGTEYELERWTLSWGRLFELRPLTGLDRRIADQTAIRLLELIGAVQPILDEAALPPERAAGPRRQRFDAGRRRSARAAG